MRNRVLFHYFENFLAEYESRFEREYGFFRPVVKDVVEKYLDRGNPRCGFALTRPPREGLRSAAPSAETGCVIAAGRKRKFLSLVFMPANPMSPVHRPMT
jgi:hypothetical protein